MPKEDLTEWEEMLDFCLNDASECLSRKQEDMLTEMADQIEDKHWLSDKAKEIIEDIYKRCQEKMAE